MAPGTLLIVAVMPAPAPGSSEWVEIFNPGPEALALAGWSIDDGQDGAAVALDEGGLIEPLATLRVSLPRAILNNSGDTARLLGPDGSVVDQLGYTSAEADTVISRAGPGAPATAGPGPAIAGPATALPIAGPAAAPPDGPAAPAAAAPGAPAATLAPPATIPAWLSSATISPAPAYTGGPGVSYRYQTPTSSPRPTAPPSPEPPPPPPAPARPSPVLGGLGLLLTIGGCALLVAERPRGQPGSPGDGVL